MGISAATAIQTGNVWGFVGGLVGGAALGGLASNLGSNLAAGMIQSGASWGFAGAVGGAAEFAIAGFGSGFGAALASGASLKESFSAGGIGAAWGATAGAIIQGSYLAGWQESLHGFSKGDLKRYDVGVGGGGGGGWGWGRAGGNVNVEVYRGVARGHPGFENARRGIATPRGGHRNPYLHNKGDTMSEFTSWTTDRSVAERFAGKDGVVLEMTVDKSKLISSPNRYSESEVLIQGPVSGANVHILYGE